MEDIVIQQLLEKIETMKSNLNYLRRNIEAGHRAEKLRGITSDINRGIGDIDFILNSAE